MSWHPWGIMQTIHEHDHKPTLLAYFSLMLSSIATALSLEKSSGAIWIRSEIVVCRSQKKKSPPVQAPPTYQDKHDDRPEVECINFQSYPAQDMEKLMYPCSGPGSHGNLYEIKT